MEDANEMCDALNEYEENRKEIERLKADVKHWMEARRVAVSCGEMMQEELKKLRDELKIAQEEIKRLRSKAGE
jgi:DNA repair ATPase RecN